MISVILLISDYINVAIDSVDSHFKKENNVAVKGSISEVRVPGSNSGLAVQPWASSLASLASVPLSVKWG